MSNTTTDALRARYAAALARATACGMTAEEFLRHAEGEARRAPCCKGHPWDAPLTPAQWTTGAELAADAYAASCARRPVYGRRGAWADRTRRRVAQNDR